MSRSRLRPVPVLLTTLLLGACGHRIEPQHLRPTAPAANGGRPVSDPPPSRIVLHATVFREALIRKMAESLPRTGEGDAQVFAGQRVHYTWQREPVTLKFDRGRVVVGVAVHGRFNLLGERTLPLTITLAGEPVMTPDFQALLQSTEVQVVASGPVESVNRAIEATLRDTVMKTVDTFRFDVRPLLSRAFEQLARPIEIPVGDQVACAELKVTSLEAAPTVLADGLEKDLGIVVMPSVTLPCTPEASLRAPPPPETASPGTPDTGDAGDTRLASYAPPAPGPELSVPPPPPARPPVPIPLLQNVSTLPSGPFRVVVPVAARYEELSRALETSMNGRLYFSASNPELYMERPQVYPSHDSVVIRMNLGGKAQVGGYAVPVGGELFFAGHPHVLDNQLSVPDLEIAPGTASELVKLKFALDYASIRDQARQALRVDVSERLAAVKDKLSTELSFAEDQGCVRGQVLRSEVTGVHPHANFLRIYVQVDAQLGLYMPCKQ
ncbi:DUF4403 family protein [Archangium primigenium]|uniref:DUF4403 family protein n=1 Tax=[Archangium] primigenium TaxID=2792470 RepID=UPI00195994E5|nr:DUF4403 family protein [Archangium primigenium]